MTAAYYYKQPGGISFVLFTLSLSQFNKALSDFSCANEAGLNKLITLQRAVQCIIHLRAQFTETGYTQGKLLFPKFKFKYFYINPLSPKEQTDLSSNVHVFPRLDCIRVLREFAMHRFPSQYKRTATNPLVRPGKCGC